MSNGYRKINGCRISAYAPDNPARPSGRLTLPQEHPCHGCPLINLTGSRPYCFLPKCLRQELTEHTNINLRKKTAPAKYPTKPQDSPIFRVQICNPEHTAPRLFICLDLPATDEEMIDALDFIGVSLPFEAVIVNFESRIEGLDGLTGEGTPLDLLNDLAGQIDRMDEAEYIKYRAVLASEGMTPRQIKRDRQAVLRELLEYSYRLDNYRLLTNTAERREENSV